MSQCQATTQKGTQCSFKAKNGSFCGRHTPSASSSTAVSKKVDIYYDAMEIMRQLKNRDNNLVDVVSSFLFDKEINEK